MRRIKKRATCIPSLRHSLMRDVVCRLAGLRLSRKRIEMAAIAELVVMGSRNEAASPGKQQTNKCSAEYEP